MYGRNATQATEYCKNGKMSRQSHVSVSSHYSSSSQHNNLKKFDLSHRQKLDEKNLSFQKSGVSNHVSKSSHERNKHCKVQGAFRGCGNWSEHVSSSGKKYFYNNVSEVSQWEKPKDWSDGSAINLKDKAKPAVRRSVSKNHHARPANSTKSHGKPDNGKDICAGKNFCDRDYRNKSSAGCGSGHDYKDIDYRGLPASQNSDTKASDKRSIGTDKDYRFLNSRSSSNYVENRKSSNGGVATGHESYLPSTGEFYDYSTWCGNSSQSQTLNGRISNGSSQASQHSIEGVADAATNIDHANSPNSKDARFSSSSEFMQKLSNTLTQGSAASTNDSYKSKANIQNVFRLLLEAANKSQNEKSLDSYGGSSKSEELDSDDTPPIKRVRLVASGSDIEPPINTEPTAAEIVHSQSEFKSLQDLKSVFDPSLILHVQNWPAEHSEEQCHHLAEDFHRFMADSMPELSASLTNARSKVRASEIHSTLQEQRILYIRQQIKDLERSSTSSGPFS